LKYYFSKKDGWCNGRWIRELQIREIRIETNNGFNYCNLDDEEIFKAVYERLLFNWTHFCLVWSGMQYGEQYTIKIRIPECFYSWKAKYRMRLRYCSYNCC